MAARCPGLEYEVWPAWEIDWFFDPPPYEHHDRCRDRQGNEYPCGVAYQMRGWAETAGDWRTPDERQAINGDLMNGYHVAIRGHQTGVNIGYSDASVTFISMDTPWDDSKTLKEQLLIWAPVASQPIGILPHLEVYKWFDTQ